MKFDGKTYFSHSRVGLPGTPEYESYKGKYPLVALSEDRKFEVLDLGDDVLREYDTEAKFLEFVATMKKPDEEFVVTILSEKPICKSCQGVVKQFKKMYPKSTVNIVSGNPDYGEANSRDERGMKNWYHRGAKRDGKTTKNSNSK